MFLELYNKSIMSFKIADELSDDDFRQGWRIRKYLKNSDVNNDDNVSDTVTDDETKKEKKYILVGKYIINSFKK